MKAAQDANRVHSEVSQAEGAPDPPTRLQLPVWTALSGGFFLPLGLCHRRRPPFGKEGCKHMASFLVPI